MDVLDLVPVRWFSSNFNVFQEGVLFAELQFSSWRENGWIILEGGRYAIRKDGIFSNRFLLEKDGQSLCQGTMKTFWNRTIFLEYEGVSYVLKSASLGSRVQVLRDGLDLGAVYRGGFWGRRARAEFEDVIPLMIKVFMLWLICLGWNRDAAG